MQKFLPCNQENAIFLSNNGCSFGDCIFSIRGDLLNADNKGFCRVGTINYYNIAGEA